MSALAGCAAALSIVKTLAFNRIGQALRRWRFFRPQLSNFGVPGVAVIWWYSPQIKSWLH